MTTLPLDTSKLTLIAAGEAYAPTNLDGTPVCAKDGTPTWVVPVLLAGPRRQPELVKVKINGATAPQVRPGTTLRLVDLVVTMWELNGRHGLAYRATSVDSGR